MNGLSFVSETMLQKYFIMKIKKEQMNQQALFEKNSSKIEKK